MKKMEFMREADKLILSDLSRLIKKGYVSSVNADIRWRRGTCYIKINNFYFKIYTYCTGCISWSYGSCTYGRSTPFNPYYIYNPDDDHKAVLKQLNNDLNKLSALFARLKKSDCYSYGPNMFNFKYGEAVTMN